MNIRKPSFLNVWLLLIVKYFLLFMILGFFKDRFIIILFDNSDSYFDFILNLFYYSVYFCFMGFIFATYLVIPLYFALKPTKPLNKVIALLITFFIEYYIYTELTPANVYYGLGNCLLSLIVIGFMYHKHIMGCSAEAVVTPQ